MEDEVGGKSLFEDIFRSTEIQQKLSATEKLDLGSMDRASRLIQLSFSIIENGIIPGTSTLSIAKEIERFLLKNGADPGLIVSTSPEDIAWHGLPDETPLRSGEIVTVDVACSVRGWWADAARTFCVGRVNEEKRRLIRAAWESMRAVIYAMKVGDIGDSSGEAVKQICCQSGFALVNEAAGHGIGNRLHMPPSLTYDGRIHKPLVSDRVYTAEPILSAGSGIVLIAPDGRAVTADAAPTAHFEVSALLVEHGALVLGAPKWIDHPPC